MYTGCNVKTWEISEVKLQKNPVDKLYRRRPRSAANLRCVVPTSTTATRPQVLHLTSYFSRPYWPSLVQQSPPHMAQKTKNLCRFTRELDEKLIELVSKNELLYDTNHKYYKDMNVRDDVWLAISSMVGKSVQDCKTRWRSLRDLYHRKKKDQKMGKKARTPWEYMENMAFLEGFTTEKRQVPDEEEEVSGDENIKIEIKEEFDYTAASCSFTPQHELFSPPKKQRMEEHHCSNYDNTTILHLLKEVRELTNLRNHPISSFFDSMARTVMQFPAAQAAEVKLKVCQIVTEMECKILEESGNYPENFEHFE